MRVEERARLGRSGRSIDGSRHVRTERPALPESPWSQPSPITPEDPNPKMIEAVRPLCWNAALALDYIVLHPLDKSWMERASAGLPNPGELGLVSEVETLHLTNLIHLR